MRTDDKACREVRDSDGRFHFIDVLPARAGGFMKFHLDVLGSQFHVNVFYLRQDRDRSGRGVDPSLLFGYGNALYSMYPRLVAQGLIGVLAVYFKNRF